MQALQSPLGNQDKLYKLMPKVALKVKGSLAT